MEKNYKKEMEDKVSFPCSSDLRGRQSVRATFKLTGKAIDAISIVAAHLGIKQKSLFDHLIDDRRSLQLIAQEIEPDSFNNLKRIQKTYVISRRTLSCLEDASKKFDTPRDALVEFSIQRLLPVISEEREKHQRRKIILNKITEFLKQGEIILEESWELLGEDDPVSNKFQTAMKAFHSTYNGLELFIKKGEIIENF
ncbi:MAG: hypothetical protein SV375_05790 [Thermodesulfobacteriota bacterium]|nr:hypothetical protein [Thermodesulfobacteriota bacterium]